MESHGSWVPAFCIGSLHVAPFCAIPLKSELSQPVLPLQTFSVLSYFQNLLVGQDALVTGK